MSRQDAKQPQRWPLLEAGFAPATIAKYKPAVHRFIDWCIRTGQDPSTTDELDELLADYFQQIHDDNNGSGKSIASATLHGIHMYLPRLKAASALPIASAICKRWHKSKPPTSHPPLTWELTVVIACQMARAGHYNLGVATLVGFDCLLRKEELMSLRRENFADAKDVRLSVNYQKAVLSLDRTKTGRDQSVELRNKSVLHLLSQVARSTKPRALIFPGGAQKYYRVFKATCRDLGLSSRYVPHSLRHGGATLMLLQGIPIEEIIRHGRWKSSESVKTYIKAGRAQLMAMKAPLSVSVAGLHLAKDIIKSMALTQKH